LVAGGIAPGIVLAILPKCPVCIAAWAAVSIPAAARLRFGVVILCTAMLGVCISAIAGQILYQFWRAGVQEKDSRILAASGKVPDW